MRNGKPSNTTRSIGTEQGYEELHIADVNLDNGAPCMYTMWCPTSEELATLNAGGIITVAIMGIRHPPIKVSVCDGDGLETIDTGIVQ